MYSFGMYWSCSCIFFSPFDTKVIVDHLCHLCVNEFNLMQFKGAMTHDGEEIKPVFIFGV